MSPSPFSSLLWTLAAHEKATCALSFSPCPSLGPASLLATGSTDRTVKLWDVGPSGSPGGPSLLHCARPQLGAVFALGFCSDDPRLLAMGGSKGQLALWDTGEEPSVRKRFGRPRQ